MVLKKAHPIISRFLEKFFHLLYHTLAWSYDLVAATVSLGRWNKWIRSIYPMISTGRILELGFGPGHLQADLVKTGQTIFGIDESPQMCLSSLRRMKRLGLPITLIRADAQAIPFPSAHFNIVVATFPSPYIFQDSTVHEIRRVLSTNGKLVVLLAALPMGKSPGDRIINQLFKITGEAPPPEKTFEKFEEHCFELGLRISHQWLNYNADRLLVFTGISETPGKGKNNGTAQPEVEEA